MKLDSFAYRAFFHLRRVLRFPPGPYPIIWNDNPHVTYKVPEGLERRLTASERANLRSLKQELEVLSRIYTYLPSSLSEKDWITLCHLSTWKQRFQQIIFFRKVEGQRSKQLNKKREPTSSAEDITDVLPFDERPFMITPQKICDVEHVREDMRLLNAYQMHDNPSICIDCRFLQDHSHRGANLTFQQLNHLFGQNRSRKVPWRLDYVNFNTDDANLMDKQRRYMLVHDSNRFCGRITSKSYLDLYQREKIIYLSPHTENVLSKEELLDNSKCFVIGGIVDRVREDKIHPEASAIAAQQEGVALRRLPLDENVEWKAGNRLLTLTTVLKILQDTYDANGDWSIGLTRYRETMNEVKPLIKKKQENLRIYNSEVMRLVQQHVQNSRIKEASSASVHS